MILYIVIKLLSVIKLLIVADALLSWMPVNVNSKFINLIHNFSEPILRPARNIQQSIIPDAPIDFSPIIVLMLLQFITKILY